MKKIYVIVVLLFLCLVQQGYSQVLRSMTPRYNNASVKGNIVFVSNNIITSSGAITTEAPPGGTATNNGHTGLNVDVDGTPPTSYIAFGSNWKYLDNNTRPVGWETVAYVDTA